MIPNSLQNSVRYFKSPARSVAEEANSIEGTVKSILSDIKERGDQALKELTRKFDKIEIEKFEISRDEQLEAVANLDPRTRADTEFAIANVRAFAEAQRSTMQSLDVERLPGVHLGHRIIPIRRVGCYVPGGRYPLLSAPVMTITPAKVAGCAEVLACLPPGAHPAMIAGCHLAGADRIFRIGGAQAIAAMAFGTETVPAVDKIVGPGNAFVNEAKRQVFGRVGIDALAGPSEIFIVADETARGDIVATDLLAQAEHDVHTRVGLITTDKKLAEDTLSAIESQLKTLSTATVAGTAWHDFGEITICSDEESMIAYSEHIAAEHLQVHTRAPHDIARKLNNYGSLFIGERASVVYSDKCCGTNHTLPTMSAARYTGGLWVGSFLKVCTHQWLSPEGVAAVAPPAIRQSASEKLEGHRRAAELRLTIETRS